MNEIYHNINGYQNLYIINREGTIISLKKNKEITHKDDRGYCKVQLSRDGIKKTFYVHRLVWDTFNGLNEGMTINHKDGNRSNNCIDNLEEVSHKQNLRSFNKRSKGQSSKFRGVSKTNGGKWRAYIQPDRRQVCLGVFKNEIDAAKAWNEKAKELGFGEGALNPV